MLFFFGFLTVLFGTLFYSFHIFGVNKVMELAFFVFAISFVLIFWHTLHKSGTK